MSHKWKKENDLESWLGLPFGHDKWIRVVFKTAEEALLFIHCIFSRYLRSASQGSDTEFIAVKRTSEVLVAG